jgi:hypothetical protein
MNTYKLSFEQIRQHSGLSDMLSALEKGISAIRHRLLFGRGSIPRHMGGPVLQKKYYLMGHKLKHSDMAYDEKLAERIRMRLEGLARGEEKKMMGAKPSKKKKNK